MTASPLRNSTTQALRPAAGSLGGAIAVATAGLAALGDRFESEIVGAGEGEFGLDSGDSWTC